MTDGEASVGDKAVLREALRPPGRDFKECPECGCLVLEPYDTECGSHSDLLVVREVMGS